MATDLSGPAPASPVLRAGAVLVLSFGLGCLTSFAQGFLPESLSSFANSASGWTLLTAVLVFFARPRWWLGALLGAASFVLLTVGYAVVSTLRGYPYSPLLFSVIGLVVGPFVGVAACWLRQRGLRAALGTAALAGVAIGEGGYGLTAVSETTSPVYWIVIATLGAVLLLAMVIWRIRGWRSIIIAVLATLATAALFNLAYSALGGV